MKSYTQPVLVLLIVLFISWVEPPNDVLHKICLGCILAFGIPHGALDHKIHHTLTSGTSIFQYILKYIGIAIGFTVWWIFMPFKAFVMFLLLSAFHFGQEQLEDHGFKSKNILPAASWGCFILIVPLFLNYNELKPYMETITGVHLMEINERIRIVIACALGAVGLLVMLRSYVKREIELKSFIRLMVCGVFIQVSYWLLPFVVAFTIYFLFFHSFNAFSHQFHWMKKFQGHYTLKKFMVDLSYFSFVAVIGILVTLWFLRPLDFENLIGYFFMFTSLLTLPHAILFDQFYTKRKEKSPLSTRKNLAIR